MTEKTNRTPTAESASDAYDRGVHDGYKAALRRMRTCVEEAKQKHGDMDFGTQRFMDIYLYTRNHKEADIQNEILND